MSEKSARWPVLGPATTEFAFDLRGGARALKGQRSGIFMPDLEMPEMLRYAPASRECCRGALRGSED